MGLELVCGPTGSGKTTRAIETFLAALGRGEKAVFIAPSLPDARHFERQIIRRLGSGGEPGVLTGGRVTTFDGLCSEVLDRAENDLRLVGSVERSLMLRTVVDKVPLEFVKQSSVYGGFIEALCRLLAEMESAGIEPQKLADKGKLVRSIPRKLNNDIFRIYEEYRAELADQSAFDIDLARRQALANLSVLPETLQYEALVVHGFHDFTPFELSLLRVMAEQRVELMITSPYVKNRKALISPGRYVEVLKPGHECTELKPRSRVPRAAALDHLDNFLFEDDVSEIQAGDAIKLLQGAGARGQAELVAAEIIHLARLGTSLDEIAVVGRSLDADSVAVAAALEEFGVPFEFQGAISLMDLPVGQAAISALKFTEALLGSVHVSLDARQSLFSFLRCDLQPAPEKIVDEFARQVLFHGIKEPHELLDKWNAIAGYELIELTSLAAAAMSGLKELCTELFALLGKLLSKRFSNRIEKGAAERLHGMDILCLKAIKELCGEAGNLKSVSPASGIVSVRLIADSVEAATIDYPAGSQRGCVRLLDPHRILNQNFKVVFMCSLLEGKFPSLGREDPFFSDAERKLLNEEGGLDLNTNEHRLDEERFLFHRVITRAETKVYFCYPYCSENGKETVRSLFIDEVLDLFEELDSSQILHKAISDITFSTSEAPTASQALRSLCIRAGELRPFGSDELMPDAVIALEKAASPAGLEQRLHGVLAAPTVAGVSLSDPAILEKFAAINTFSATSLERYASCPFAYFVDNYFRPALIEFDDYAMEQGNIAHAVLAKFMRKINPYAQLGSADERQMSMVRDIMDQLIDEAFQDMGTDSRALFMRKGIEFYLHRFIEREAAIKCDLVPSWFERRFCADGRRKHNPDDEEGCLNLGDGILVSGVIDRVDICDVTAARKKALVIDYKMAVQTRPAASFEKSGIVQIPLYMLALREIWGLDPVGGYYYSLKNNAKDYCRGLVNADEAGVFGNRKIVRTDKKSSEEFEEILSEAKARALDLAKRIRAADFPPSFTDCTYCDYGSVCGGQSS
ncbi:MAG: PD-(D/E)XK nuclease family protein [Thermoleophilia bacterium]